MRGAMIAVSMLAGGWLGGPAAAQGLSYFYCYAPDPASGNLYVSQTLPIGPVAERAGYGPAFVAYLRARGLLGSGANGYCVMRASEAEIERGRKELADACPECGGATRFTPVVWTRGAPADRAGGTSVAPTGAKASPPKPAPRYKQSIGDAVRQNDPGVCYANADGSVRCTGSGSGGPSPSASTKARPVADTAQNSARAELCQTGRGGTAMRQPCTNRPAEVVEPPKVNPNPGGKQRTNKPKASQPQPPAKPQPQYRSVCAELTPGSETRPVVRVAKPEVVVTMSPGALLYLRDLVTGMVFRLGHGRHVIPTGDYVLAVIGVANAGNPFQQKVQACLQHDVSPTS